MPCDLIPFDEDAVADLEGRLGSAVVGLVAVQVDMIRIWERRGAKRKEDVTGGDLVNYSRGSEPIVRGCARLRIVRSSRVPSSRGGQRMLRVV